MNPYTYHASRELIRAMLNGPVGLDFYSGDLDPACNAQGPIVLAFETDPMWNTARPEDKEPVTCPVCLEMMARARVALTGRTKVTP